jgi:hypothetical protein
MMSDLAPFVAAVIRDRVMAELKDENEALRQEIAALKLERHRHNPRRSVQVTGSDGKEIFFVENELHLDTLSLFFGRRISFCNPGGYPNPKLPAKALYFKCGSWLTLELWIDGGSAVRLQDLSFHYTTYDYVKTLTADGDEWKGYVATVEARDGDDLTLEILIFISPDDHAELLNREQSVDFLPPTTERLNAQYSIEDSLNQEIPLSRLLEICSEKNAMVCFSDWTCTSGWFRRHIMVPFESYSWD